MYIHVNVSQNIYCMRVYLLVVGIDYFFYLD